MLPRHSDKEVDDETPTWKFDQSQISNNIIYNAVALLNDYRVHEGANVAVFTMLDNILKYGKPDVRSSMGKQMLPNLLTLMRNHPSDDPNKHWREIHEKPKTAQDAGIGLLIDLLKFLGPSVGDKNRVVFAIISSMTHVDEYSVQVSAVKILYMMLSNPRKWKVSSMAVRLILPVKVMNSLDHLVRYMKRQEVRRRSTSENMCTKRGGRGSFW